MLYNSNLKRQYCTIRPCFEKKITRINEGLPVKRVVIKSDTIATNSKAFRSTLADVNDDQLEIDLATGVRLERVPSQVLAPERLDFSMRDVKEIKAEEKLIDKGSSKAENTTTTTKK